MVERVIERVSRSEVDKVVVAAPHDLGIDLSVPLFIGDEHDVLKRYYDCAKFFKADNIVRITADCPLILPEIINDCIFFRNELMKVDYVAAVEPDYPDGLDVEVFTFDALERTHKAVKSKIEREHVTPWMRENLECHYLDFWEGKMDKVSVDTLKDLRRVRKLWNGKVKLYYL